MRKSKVETADTRRRIVEVAAREFRIHGIQATGLNNVMSPLGLTQGGFYRHFSSKDQLIAEACSQAMTEVIDGLAANGQMVVVGASAEPIEVTPIQLISGERSIQGWASGTSIDSEDTLGFSVLSGVRPMIETVPLERAAEAFDRMMSGAARFRMVLTMA